LTASDGRPYGGGRPGGDEPPARRFAQHRRQRRRDCVGDEDRRGTAFNVIPDKAEMEGTMRAFDEEVREKVPELMERVVKGVADAHGASFSFEYYRGPDPVVNDEEVARVVEETARELFGEEAVEAPAPTMGRTSRLTSELLRRLSSWWARRTKRRASPTRITTRASTSTRTPCPSA
jgi:metal-dependent amidase/aminoacylase/carboxypeptidase family protein